MYDVVGGRVEMGVVYFVKIEGGDVNEEIEKKSVLRTAGRGAGSIYNEDYSQYNRGYFSEGRGNLSKGPGQANKQAMSKERGWGSWRVAPDLRIII